MTTTASRRHAVSRPAPHAPVAAVAAIAALAGVAGCSRSPAADASPSPSPSPSTYAKKILGGLDRGLIERGHYDMHAIGVAIASYASSENGPPEATDIAALAALLSPTYLHVLPQTDPWGFPFLYQKTAEGWTLTSVGADGTLGGDDDTELTDGGFTKEPQGYKPNL